MGPPPTDPYARIHDALHRATTEDDTLDPDWYLTDFLVIGVGESFHPDNKGMSITFRIGPEESMPPHRILGLLEYALTQYKATITTHEEDN